MPNKKNVFLFVEESRSYKDRHVEDKILVSDDETIEQLFQEYQNDITSKVKTN